MLLVCRCQLPAFGCKLHLRLIFILWPEASGIQLNSVIDRCEKNTRAFNGGIIANFKELGKVSQTFKHGEIVIYGTMEGRD